MKNNEGFTKNQPVKSNKFNSKLELNVNKDMHQKNSYGDMSDGMVP